MSILAAARLWQRVWNSEALKWGLIISNLFSYMLHVWGLTLFRNSIDYQRAGTLAQWFTGILTSGTVTLAALAFRRDRQKYNAEKLRLETAEIMAAKKETEQAKLQIRASAGAIYCWLFPAWDWTGKRIERIECHIENRTPIPLYDWAISFDYSDKSLDSKVFGPAVPGHTIFPLRDQEWFNLLRDGIPPRTQITFHASNGELLKRDIDGNLSCITSA